METPKLKEKNTFWRDEDARGCLALLLAVGLPLFMFFGLGAIYLNEPRGTALLYPLLLVTQYGPLQGVLWGGVTLVFTGLLIFAGSRQMLATLIAFLIGGFFLFFGFCFGVGSAHMQPYQTLWYGDHMYRLIAVWDGGDMDFGLESESYQVLDCEPLGLVCYRIKTPYHVQLRGYDGTVHQFDPSGQLFVDEVTQMLILRVGSEVYPILNAARAGM